jgi:hypothetical protein
MIVYVKVRSDPNTGELIRGNYECVIIPRGDFGYSASQNREIPTPVIMTELTQYLYDAKRQFEPMPKRIITFKGEFQNVDVINTEEYRTKKREEKWKRLQSKDDAKNPGESKRIKELEHDKAALLEYMKMQGFTNNDLGSIIGKSEAAVRNGLRKSSKNSINIPLYKVQDNGNVKPPAPPEVD